MQSEKSSEISKTSVAKVRRDLKFLKDIGIVRTEIKQMQTANNAPAIYYSYVPKYFKDNISELLKKVL